MEKSAMKRTVTALYETRAQAEQVHAALVAAHLGDDVDIHEDSKAATDGGPEHHDFKTWLSGLMGGHDDKHVYIEGVRRGHFMLSAKVDELSETRAAEILDAAAPVDLENAQHTWRTEGWTPPAESVDSGVMPERAGGGDLAGALTPQPRAKWVGVRVYSTEESPLDY
jgi:hypothetical protein